MAFVELKNNLSVNSAEYVQYYLDNKDIVELKKLILLLS